MRRHFGKHLRTLVTMMACALTSACSSGDATTTTDGGTTPPRDGGSTPPRDGGSAPPRDGGGLSRPDAGPAGIVGTPGPPTPMTPTYYVDFGSGDDTADGRSQATAWKHCPGDDAATATAAGTALVAGDVVIFRGGVEYDGGVTIASSGTSGMPIFFDGNVHRTWGTEAAIVDGQRMRTFAFESDGQSWLTIDGFVLRRFSTDDSSTAVHVRRGDHVEVRNNRISEVYFATNPGGTTWEQQNGIGIYFDSSSDGSIHDNVVRDCGNSGIIYNSQNGVHTMGGEIFANEVTNMNIGIRVTLGNSDPGTGMTGLHVYSNYIHDFDQYYVSSAWHRDGIHVFARPESDAVQIDAVEIAGNFFEDHTTEPGSTAWIYIEYACKDFRIHHNVLNASRSYYAIRILGDGFLVAGNHEISSNVIYNVNGIGGAGLHVGESTGTHLYDNIWLNEDQAYFIQPDSMAGFDSDNNLFFRTGGATRIATLNAGPAEAPTGDTYDLADMQSMTPFEHHSVFGDPLFAMDPMTVRGDASGLAPQPTSPAIDAARDLGFTRDYRGGAIPMGAAPDIGAFEVR